MKKLLFIAGVVLASSVIMQSCRPYNGLQTPQKHPRKPKPFAAVPYVQPAERA